MTERRLTIIIEGRDQASGPIRGVGGALGNIAQIATGILTAGLFERLASGIFSLGREALDSIANYERLGATMQTLVARELMNTGAATDMASALGMAGERAKELVGWTEQLAIKSPFDQQGVADAFRTALAYGFVTDEAQRLTQATIDFAAGSGGSVGAMNQIALALGQMKAKGKLAGQEILQLVNAGIPVRQILADAFGVTTAELERMQEQGLIPANKAIEAIVSSLEKDFGGAAARQTNTWAGLINTLGDVKKIGLREFFGGIAEAVQPLVADFAEWLQGPGLVKLKEWGTVAGQVASYFIGLAQAFMETGDIFSSEFMESLTAFLPQEMQDKFFAFMAGVKATIDQFKPAFQGLINFLIINGPGISETIQSTFGKLADLGQMLLAKVLPFLVEQFNKISAWFIANGPLIQAFAVVVGDTLVGLGQVVVAAWGVVGPILTALIDLVLGLGRFIMQVATGDWAGAWATLQSTALSVGASLWQAVKGFLNMIAVAFGSNLSEIGRVWSSNWFQFKQILSSVMAIIENIVREKIAAISNTFSGIVNAIQDAIAWVRNLASAFASLVIPDWLTPGSPTPLELGLRGINNAMRSLSSTAMPNLSSGFSGLSPALPMGLASAGAGVGSGIVGGGGDTFIIQLPMISMMDEQDVLNKLIPLIEKAKRRAV